MYCTPYVYDLGEILTPQKNAELFFQAASFLMIFSYFPTFPTFLSILR